MSTEPICIFESDDDVELDEVRSVDSIEMASPAPSVYSLTSSLREQSYRTEHGRYLNSYSEVYYLPADEEEITRLERQHYMFKSHIDQWVLPVPQVMAPEPGVTKAVLDLGCGSGAWIADTASAFPECSAVGVDLVPVRVHLPPNCRSEVDDINLGLEHFYNSFDLVHARLISSGIKDYPGLIDHIAKVLRPRGLVILMEFDFRIYRPDKTVCSSVDPQEPGYSLCLWLDALRRAITQRGGSPDAATYMHVYLHQHPSFPDDEIFTESHWCPTGPFDHKDHWTMPRCPKEFGEMMAEDAQAFLRSGRMLLLGSGMPPNEVEHLEFAARREVDEKVPLYILIKRVYARKAAN